MARPRAEIDKNQFEKLCAMMCTEDEIAGFFGVSIDTLQRWCKRTYGEGFETTYSAKKARGKAGELEEVVSNGRVKLKVVK